MSDWSGFRFHLLTSVPRPEPEQQGADSRPGDQRLDPDGSLVASLTASHGELLTHGDEAPALLAAWARAPEEQRLRFVLGGRPHFPPAVDDRAPAHGNASGTPAETAREQPVLFPPGAVAAPMAEADAATLFERFAWWVPCSGRTDALWAPLPSRDRPEVVHRGSFDRHAAHLRQPLVWLVLAEPLRPAELKPELDQLVNEILPLSRGEVGEAKRVGLERKQARHRELRRAELGGAWRIRVLVGGTEPEPTAIAAAMLCAAGELEGLPYVLAPAGRPTTLPAALTARTHEVDGGPVAFTAGTELLAALVRPPERELPGIRLVEPHTFDVTPDLPGTAGLALGAVLDDAGRDVGSLVLNPESLNRHTFVCGATGAGKSQTVRHLLTEATRAGLPWLVVEPAKAEYARMATRLAPLGADVVVIRPGDPETAPAGFNPLEPGDGFPLQTHLDRLRALFLAAFASYEPFPQVLASALTRSYEQLGWDLALGEPARPGHGTRYPTLGDLQRVAAEVVTDIGYGKDVSADIHGFVKVRLSSLRLGATGRFFEGGHPLDFTALRDRNVVLEIEDVGDDADKAFFMGAVLMRLAEHLWVDARNDPARKGLRHLTVVEEAHRLLRRPDAATEGPAAHAVEMFAALLAEVRAYGEGLVIAEQIPSKLTPDVIKNTAVKIVHRLPAHDDRDTVGATMNLHDAQSRHLVTLVPGDGAVFTDGMDRPLLVHVPDGSRIEDQPFTTAPVADLIGRRSTATCGPDCHTDACTLRQIRTAHHLLDQQPWLILCCELVVLAHLVGEAPPVLDAAHRQLLATVDHRTLDCALAHAVDGAVAARSAQLHPSAPSLDAFAGHCVEVIRAALAAGEAGPAGSVAVACCDPSQPFISTPYRWYPVLAALYQDLFPEDRHPDSASWEQRFQCPIPGATRAEQYDAVRAMWQADLSDKAACDAVAFGGQRPSALELAVGTTADDPRWAPMAAAALGAFAGADWAPTYLLPPPEEHAEAREEDIP